MSEIKNAKWHTRQSKTEFVDDNQQIQMETFVDLFNSIKLCI